MCCVCVCVLVSDVSECVVCVEWLLLVSESLSVLCVLCVVCWCQSL